MRNKSKASNCCFRFGWQTTALNSCSWLQMTAIIQLQFSLVLAWLATFAKFAPAFQKHSKKQKHFYKIFANPSISAFLPFLSPPFPPLATCSLILIWSLLAMFNCPTVSSSRWPYSACVSLVAGQLQQWFCRLINFKAHGYVYYTS